MRHRRLFMAALVLVVLVASIFMLSACIGDVIPGADSIIIVDVGNLDEIHAQVEMIIDDAGKVITINALNEEGEIALIDTKFSGQSYKVAMQNFINLSKNMGYINNLSNTVFIDSICADDIAKVQLNRELFNIIKETDKAIDVKSYSYTAEKLRYRSFIRSIEGLENLSFLQYSLITSIMKYEETVKLAELLKLNIKDLTIKLVNLYENSRTCGSSAMAKEIRKEISVQKSKQAAMIADVIGGDVLSIYASHSQLYNTLVSIMVDRSSKSFSDNELNQILAKVDIVSEPEKTNAKNSIARLENGIVVYKASSISDYIENLYKTKSFATDQLKLMFEYKIDAARKLFDPIYTPINANERILIEAVLEGQPELDMLSKVVRIDQAHGIIVKLAERFNSVYNTAKNQLSAVDLAKVNSLELNYNNVDASIMQQYQPKIDEELARLRNIKQTRLDNYSK